MLDSVLSPIDNTHRTRLSAPERVALMKRARRLQERLTLAWVDLPKTEPLEHHHG